MKLGIAGLRPQKLGGYHESSSLNIIAKNFLANDMTKAYESGYREFHFGMAQGVDTWAMESLIAYKESSSIETLTIVGHIPLWGECNPWPKIAQLRWLKLVKSCDHAYVCDVALQLTRDDLDALPADEIPSQCLVENTSSYAAEWLNKRAFHLVDSVDALYVMWDGQRGGTYNTIKYALKIGVPVYCRNPLTGISELLSTLTLTKK